MGPPRFCNPASGNPRVSIIVPARNEEEAIEQSLIRLLELDYDNYEVIAVDDRSTDRTGEIMEAVAQNPHPSSSAQGKLLAKEARNGAPGFTRDSSPRIAGRMAGQNSRHVDGCESGDRGVVVVSPMRTCCSSPTLCGALWLTPRRSRADHVVLFPQMIMKRPGEYMMIAFFQTMFVFGHRPWKVADPKARDHMGVGAFNLVRRQVYDAVGTYAALRMEVLDDMKLGKVVKNAGFAQREVFGGRFDFDALGEGGDGRRQQSHQEFFCHTFFSVVANVGLGLRVGFSESGAVSRSVAGAWLGACAVRDCARIDVS